MCLKTIINDFDAGQLLDQPVPALELARLEVEAAASQIRNQTELASFRTLLLGIESSLTKTLSMRYGCDD